MDKEWIAIIGVLIGSVMSFGTTFIIQIFIWKKEKRANKIRNLNDTYEAIMIFIFSYKDKLMQINSELYSKNLLIATTKSHLYLSEVNKKLFDSIIQIFDENIKNINEGLNLAKDKIDILKNNLKKGIEGK